MHQKAFNGIWETEDSEPFLASVSSHRFCHRGGLTRLAPI
jgi:hypothetical protein